ncbi:MAG: hypothetical protein QXX41_03090 [Nitrososphaerota archaeon]
MLKFTFLVTLLTFTLLITPIARAEVPNQNSPPENPGPYSVSWVQLNISKSGGKILSILFFYPSTFSGEGSNPNLTGAPYPVILFSPGYKTSIDFYRALALKIASWGFIFVLVGSDLESWDIDRANDLQLTLNWLDEQNDNSSFNLYQLIDESKFVASGHSLGAESALILSIYEPRIKAVVPIAPFIAFPMTFLSPKNVKDIYIPMLILVGSADNISPPRTMAYTIYENGNVPKFCLTLIGSDHFTIIYTCTKYMISFLKFYFHNEQEYARYLYGYEAWREVAIGKLDLKYDLRMVFEYWMLFKGISYKIYVYSDSTFLDFAFNESLMKMTFKIIGPPFTVGTANISIPKAPFEEYTIKIYLNGASYPFTLTDNSTLYFVYLSYNHSMHELNLFFVDLTPPTLFILSPEENSVQSSSNIVVAWISRDMASGLVYFEVKIDDSEWLIIEYAMAYEFENLKEGDHTVHIRAYDAAGNVREAYVNFKVDMTPPLVYLISPKACSDLNYPNVTVIWLGTDYVSGIDHYEVRLDNGPWINVGMNETYTFLNLTNGVHELYIRAIDKAGNIHETQISFNVNVNHFTDHLFIAIIIVITITVLCLTVPVTFRVLEKIKLRRKTYFYFGVSSIKNFHKIFINSTYSILSRCSKWKK